MPVMTDLSVMRQSPVVLPEPTGSLETWLRTSKSHQHETREMNHVYGSLNQANENANIMSSSSGAE